VCAGALVLRWFRGPNDLSQAASNPGYDFGLDNQRFLGAFRKKMQVSLMQIL
jgi:hypothetical protein